MNVFISWSGDHSRHVAAVLRQYIRKVVQEAECFFSKGDIEAGTPWLREVSDKLVSHSLGIICVTKENQERRWINYEAGALGSKLDSAHVVPLLIDVAEADLKMPLASFQAKLCDKVGLFDVFQMINGQAARHLSIEELREQFEMWWPRIEKDLNYTAPPESSPQPARNEREILDEILIGVRQLLRDREQSAAGQLSSLPQFALEEFWARLLVEIRAKRPLLLSWLEKAVPLGAEGGVFRLGFPVHETLTLESLMRPNNCKFLEAAVSELLGRPYRLEAEVRPDLRPMP